MNLDSIGRLVAERRRTRKLTLPQLAAAAGIARSTLAALEAGKLRELGFNRVARLCTALDLVLDVRAPTLDKPLMEHRHLTGLAGRELSKAAIYDVISRGDMAAWRGLIRAIRADRSGRLARRTQEMLRAAGDDEPRARALSVMLKKLRRSSPARE